MKGLLWGGGLWGKLVWGEEKLGLSGKEMREVDGVWE